MFIHLYNNQRKRGSQPERGALERLEVGFVKGYGSNKVREDISI